MINNVKGNAVPKKKEEKKKRMSDWNNLNSDETKKSGASCQQRHLRRKKNLSFFVNGGPIDGAVVTHQLSLSRSLYFFFFEYLPLYHSALVNHINQVSPDNNLLINI
ncbi:hypothetical protein PV328_008041 [Microctonus aethiopoides]|uniref:Uncharacterized protein n=1 Tax=Microctonus aethiopoides TaxID=144406 RepID=A0AA39CAV2_9HYME|nr:hypothetical protein PV328_008041 [Microctonus aethiopoides]